MLKERSRRPHETARTGALRLDRYLTWMRAQLGAVVFPARSTARTQCWYVPEAFGGTFQAMPTVLPRAADENHTCLSRATTLPPSLISSKRPTSPESSATRESSLAVWPFLPVPASALTVGGAMSGGFGSWSSPAP